jgi:ATP-dependent exoDNAse (exonuclease V) beta subunit
MTYTNAASEEMKNRIFTLMQEIVDFLDGKIEVEEIKEDDFEELDKEIKKYVYERLKEGIENINDSIITRHTRKVVSEC